MKKIRSEAIQEARKADTIFLVLSTLGRQGSVGVLEYLKRTILQYKADTEIIVVLIAEVTPRVLKNLASSSDGKRRVAFVQVGCPRLSIDWGEETVSGYPLLSPFEAHTAFLRKDLPEIYPMDYFSSTGGDWSNYGRDGNRNGSLSCVGPQQQHTAKDRLKQKWLQRKIEMQNASNRI